MTDNIEKNISKTEEKKAVNSFMKYLTTLTKSEYFH